MHLHSKVFEAWANGLQWLLCVPLGIVIDSNPSGPKTELCSAKYEALWANGVPYKLIKNLPLVTVFTCTQGIE